MQNSELACIPAARCYNRSKDAHQFVGLGVQFGQPHRRNHLACFQKTEPVEHFAGLLQGNRALVREVSPALSRLGLLNVRSDARASAKQLFPKRACHAGLLIQMLAEADDPHRKGERALLNVTLWLTHQGGPFLYSAFTILYSTDVEAQQALVRQTVTRASRTVSIANEVQQVVASKGNAIVADVLAELRDSTQFVVITGGGVLLLHPLLADVLAHEAKEPGRDYLLIDGPLASQLNAIGALFGLIFRASGK